MLGFVAGVGRVAISNALRQVARQFGREAMERIMGGEAIENVLTRDQMRELAALLNLALEMLPPHAFLYIRVGPAQFGKVPFFALLGVFNLASELGDEVTSDRHFSRN
jgi:hypothetical protein